MTEKRFKLHIVGDKENPIEITLIDNGQPLTYLSNLDDARVVRDLLNEQDNKIDTFKAGAEVQTATIQRLQEENEQLKQQMQRLYNYFADWFDDRVLPSDFSEMWDFVKEDKKWD